MKKILVVIMSFALLLAFTIFAPASKAAIPFTDVKATSSVYEPINALYEKKIVFGVTNSTYKPNQGATRGETAQMIVNALNWQNEDATNPGYTDTASSKYAKAIYILSNKGVVTYNSSTKKFNPNNSLTRAQIAKMITLAFELNISATSKTPFTDVNKLKDVQTKQYIATLVDYNITKGKTATKFGPNDKVTRGQLATFLYKGINNAPVKDGDKSTPVDEDDSDFEVIGIE